MTSNSWRGGSGQMFDAIALRYDFLNRVLSLGLDVRWRKTAIASLRLPRGSMVLDLATGTGDLAFTILKMVRESTVVGVDMSTNMLRVGARKAAAKGLKERVAFQIGDAEDLSFKDNSFDAATIAFGIRNVPDRTKALSEMARVVKNTGFIAVLELLEPTTGVMGAPARMYVRQLVPRIGAALSGSKEYKYLQESIAAFPRPTVFAKTMESAGIEVLSVTRLSFGACCLYVGRPG